MALQGRGDRDVDSWPVNATARCHGQLEAVRAPWGREGPGPPPRALQRGATVRRPRRRRPETSGAVASRSLSNAFAAPPSRTTASPGRPRGRDAHDRVEFRPRGNAIIPSARAAVAAQPLLEGRSSATPSRSPELALCRRRPRGRGAAGTCIAQVSSLYAPRSSAPAVEAARPMPRRRARRDEAILGFISGTTVLPGLLPHPRVDRAATRLVRGAWAGPDDRFQGATPPRNPWAPQPSLADAEAARPAPSTRRSTARGLRHIEAERMRSEMASPRSPRGGRKTPSLGTRPLFSSLLMWGAPPVTRRGRDGHAPHGRALPPPRLHELPASPATRLTAPDGLSSRRAPGPPAGSSCEG